MNSIISVSGLLGILLLLYKFTSIVYCHHLKQKLRQAANLREYVQVLGRRYRYKSFVSGVNRYRWKKFFCVIKADFHHDGNKFQPLLDHIHIMKLVTEMEL